MVALNVTATCWQHCCKYFTYSYSVAQYGVSGWFYLKSARSEESLQLTHSESATFGGPVTLT